MEKYIPELFLEKRIHSYTKIKNHIENIEKSKHENEYFGENKDKYYKKVNENLKTIILCNSKNNKEEFLNFLQNFNGSSVFLVGDVYIGILFICVLFKNEDFIEMLSNSKKLIYPYPLYEPKFLSEKSKFLANELVKKWDSSTEKKIVFQR